MSMSVTNSSTYLNEGSPLNRKMSGQGFWANRNALEKKLLIGSAILAVVALALVVALAVVGSKKSSEAPTSPPVTTAVPPKSTAVPTEPTTGPPEPTTTPEPIICQTEECQNAANYLLGRMNTSIDPCQDFHQYVCGKWIQDNQIPPDRDSSGVFDSLDTDLAKTCIDALSSPKAFDQPNGAIDKARAFFQSCLTTGDVTTEEGVDQLKNLLHSLNISTNFSSSDPDFQTYTALSSIVRRFGLNFILSFQVDADNEDNTKNVIFLDQPSSFGLARSFLVNVTETGVRTIAYKTYIKESLSLFNSSVPHEEMALVAEDIFNFEVEMAKLTRDPVERRNVSTWNFPMNISDFDRSVPEMNVLQYLQDILSDSGASVTPSTVIIVKEETYFKEVAILLNSTKTRVVSNYIGWRLVQSLGPALFQEMRNITFKFDQVISGLSAPVRDDERCYKMTNDNFGHAVGRLYVDRKFEKSSKEDVKNMVKNLADAFRQLLKENTWMDDTTKNFSLEKLEKMNDFIGYPEWIKDDARIDEYFKDCPMNGSDFLNRYETALSCSTKRKNEILNTPNNRTQGWVSQASIVNAYYNPSANSITFPAGILQVPFYGKRLKVLNYGAIGYVIGHEITHGYDDEGSQYDSVGNLRNWWTPETKSKFDERTKCFIDQYSSIKDELSGLYLNGAQTIGENIADNGGIREAYQAYFLSERIDERLPGLEEFSDLHLFYISAASVWCTQYRKEKMINQITQNVHSPGMYRAYVPLANTDDFAQVFQCAPGTNMNPNTKCTLW